MGAISKAQSPPSSPIATMPCDVSNPGHAQGKGFARGDRFVASPRNFFKDAGFQDADMMKPAATLVSKAMRAVMSRSGTGSHRVLLDRVR